MDCEEVVCDFCNEEYPEESMDTGGLLIGSWAICPKCAVKCDKRKADVICASDMRFHDFVIRVRAGVIH